MNDHRLFQVRPLDWQWLVLSYCFLILFHLFPSFVVAEGASTKTLIFLRTFHTPSDLWPMVVWMVTGIFAVACYVGYRSQPITILEPGLASVFYLGTLLLTMTNFGQVDTVRLFIYLALWIVLMHLFAFLIGCSGAAVGEWIQIRKEMKQAV
jgi:hypothetical protein